MTENDEPLVLVVDDQDDILQIVSLTLQYEGWRVVTARNGREGLEAIRREKPALILADLMMPEMTGIEFCRKLVEDFGMVDVPLLMISAVSEKAKILGDFWEMPLRHHNFLHKPFSTDELLSAVQAILPRHMTRYPPQATLANKPPENSPKPAPEPAPKPPAAPKVVAPFTPEAGRGFRVLVVDDDDDIRAILKATLGMFHVVEEAENGVAGIEMVDHFGPDIVVSDINMPVMNGLEMAEAIRRHPAYCSVPIFFLTAETDASLPRKAFDIGGNLYLRKPLDPVRLLKFLDHFLVETGLKPGQLHALASQRKAQAPPPPAAPAPTPAPRPAPAPPRAVRLLVIDFNFEHHRVMREYFEVKGADGPAIPGGPFEVLYADELSLALGNLTRWEPDLILYNPRTPGIPDGVAFGQSLRLRKLAQTPEVAFIGERFFQSEIEYSRTQYQRGVIEMTAGDAELTRKLSEAVAAARLRLRPKQFTYQQLHDEELERQRQLQANSAREARQREVLRQRYATLQEFIDRGL